jgi:sec-independent protein translocase protein TatC
MQMKFLDHVHEARRRLLWVVISFILSGTAAYILRSKIIAVLQRPLGSSLYYTSPAGGFNFVMEAAFLVAVFITLPVIIYQIVRFVEPALPVKIKNIVLAKLIGSSIILAILGAAFAFYILLPQSLHFFSSYASSSIKPLISTGEYLDFVAGMIITFAIVFQIPLFLLFINRIKPLNPRKILRYQKIVIIGSFVIAVILPFTYSPISQFIVVIPIIFLYYISVLLLAIVNHKSKQKTSPLPAINSFDINESEDLLTEELAPAIPVSRGLYVDGIVKKIPAKTFANTKLADVKRLNPTPLLNTRRMRTIDGFF